MTTIRGTILKFWQLFDQYLILSTLPHASQHYCIETAAELPLTALLSKKKETAHLARDRSQHLIVIHTVLKLTEATAGLKEAQVNFIYGNFTYHNCSMKARHTLHRGQAVSKVCEVSTNLHRCSLKTLIFIYVQCILKEHSHRERAAHECSADTQLEGLLALHATSSLNELYYHLCCPQTVADILYRL